MNHLATSTGSRWSTRTTAKANAMRCWNWLNLPPGARRGEPALIAPLAAHVAAHRRRRAYLAGLSAGSGAMALAGQLYPDVLPPWVCIPGLAPSAA